MATEETRKRHDEYENLTTKAARGEYTLIDPLDYIVLEMMNEEGETFAGLYPLGVTVAEIVRKLKERVPKEHQKEIKATMVAARTRVLHIQGLVRVTKAGIGNNGRSVWQRTKVGTRVLNAWKEASGDTRG